MYMYGMWLAERGDGGGSSRGRLQPAQDREPAVYREDRREKSGLASAQAYGWEHAADTQLVQGSHSCSIDDNVSVLFQPLLRLKFTWASALSQQLFPKSGTNFPSLYNDLKLLLPSVKKLDRYFFKIAFPPVIIGGQWL